MSINIVSIQIDVKSPCVNITIGKIENSTFIYDFHFVIKLIKYNFCKYFIVCTVFLVF